MQWVLGHAQLTTTQLYLSPVPEDVIASVLAYHARRSTRAAAPEPAGGRAPAYRRESLQALFGEDSA